MDFQCMPRAGLAMFNSEHPDSGGLLQAVVVPRCDPFCAATAVQNSTDVAGIRELRSAEVLVLAAVGVFTLSLVVVLGKRSGGGEPDLGCVSERWLAEYRADSTRPSL